MRCRDCEDLTLIVGTLTSACEKLVERVEALEKSVQDFDDDREELRLELGKAIPCACRCEE